MRKAISVFLVFILVTLLSVIAGLVSQYPSSEEADDAQVNSAPADDVAPEVKPNVLTSEDSKTFLRLLDGDTVRVITMDEYLLHVVAAESPASFEPAALAAQAVAARTYTLHQMLVEPRSDHPEADVCTNYEHCEAFASDEAMHLNWGDKYDEYYEKIQKAIAETDGVYMVYNGEPILAVFFSSSIERTEDAVNVWGQEIPYLVSVPTPDIDEDIPNFATSVEVTSEDFKKTLSELHPEVSFTENLSESLGDYSIDSSGRVDYVSIGGVKFTGKEMRQAFGLRSTSFDIEIQSAVTFKVSGYGHGVGMSQYGSNAMAKHGFNWREILKSYYIGISFSDEIGRL